MFKFIHYIILLSIASSLALAPLSIAWSQEEYDHDDVEKPAEDEDASSEEEEVDSYEDEGPALPDGMTLDEVLNRAEQSPHVAFVGDSINASALAQADVGLAIGTDIAIEAADVVPTSGNLGVLI